jgi:carbonic anhydrase
LNVEEGLEHVGLCLIGGVEVPKLGWKTLAAATALASLAGPVFAGQSPQGGYNAVQVLQSLTEGNARFVKGEPQRPRGGIERIKETASGQTPMATILTCSDSRVSPEFIFDQGIGDLFVIRVAGNVADTDEIGTAEYGAGHLQTPLLVVLGHTKCGAVTAVAQNAQVHGSIPELVANIKPAAVRAKGHECRACNHDYVTRAIFENVWVSIEDLFRESDEIRVLAASGKLKIVGAVYDIGTGSVQWLGEHRNQAELIAKSRSSKFRGHGAAAKGHAAPKRATRAAGSKGHGHG